MLYHWFFSESSTNHPDLLNENTRVIRRGKRRFANNAAVSRNRFSAPNLSVNVEDVDSSESTDGSSDVRNTHHGVEPVSVYEHDDDCVPKSFLLHPAAAQVPAFTRSEYPRVIPVQSGSTEADRLETSLQEDQPEEREHFRLAD